MSAHINGFYAASRYKVIGALITKKASEVTFVDEAIYKKGSVFKYPKYFRAIIGPSLKVI